MKKKNQSEYKKLAECELKARIIFDFFQYRIKKTDIPIDTFSEIWALGYLQGLEKAKSSLDEITGHKN